MINQIPVHSLDDCRPSWWRMLLASFRRRAFKIEPEDFHFRPEVERFRLAMEAGHWKQVCKEFLLAIHQRDCAQRWVEIDHNVGLKQRKEFLVQMDRIKELEGMVRELHQTFFADQYKKEPDKRMDLKKAYLELLEKAQE